MCTSYRILAVFVAISFCLADCAGQSKAENDPRWQQAVSLKESGNYADAANVYRDLLLDYPKSQRTALRIALNEQRAGDNANAAASFVTARAVDPYGYWNEVGLYYEARFHLDNGRIDGRTVMR